MAGHCSTRGYLAAALLLSASVASAQTVRPVIVEYTTQAKGRLELVNDSLVPMTALVEPKSFTIDVHGRGAYSRLDARIHLKLSTTSIRIPPKQTRVVFYEATADHLPAWFVITSSFMSPPKSTGVTLQVQLPHTVYLLTPKRLERGDVAIVEAAYDATARQIVVRLANSSTVLGRALGIDAQAAAGSNNHASAAGFPLMPSAERIVQIPWTGAAPPAEVTVKFSGFSVSRLIGSDGR